jgi:hypothetical protein
MSGEYSREESETELYEHYMVALKGMFKHRPDQRDLIFRGIEDILKEIRGNIQEKRQ